LKLEEAIRLKGLTGDEFLAADPDDLEEADRLSFEALKFRDQVRTWYPTLFPHFLPGETED